MMQAVLTSIQPVHCANIAAGKKSLEIRKNMPKLPAPFKCYIYCTQLLDEFSAPTWPYICYEKKGGPIVGDDLKEYDVFEAGYIIGEFTCDWIVCDPVGMLEDLFCRWGCLALSDLRRYKGKKPLYGWHISNLKIYDAALSLEDFGKERPPQSWCYVEEPA